MKILYRIIILCLFLLSIQSTWANDSKEKIDWIRKEYKVIRDNLNQYKKMKYDFLGESAEGAGGVGYLNNTNDIRLIELTYYGEMGKKDYEFYYSKGRVFFIFEKNYTYNTSIWDKENFDENKTEAKEWRYYFHQNNVIRIIDPNGVRIAKSENAITAREASMANYKRLKEKI